MLNHNMINYTSLGMMPLMIILVHIFRNYLYSIILIIGLGLLLLNNPLIMEIIITLTNIIREIEGPKGGQMIPIYPVENETTIYVFENQRWKSIIGWTQYLHYKERAAFTKLNCKTNSNT